MLKYRCDLARGFFAKHELALAKDQLLSCLSLIESSGMAELAENSGSGTESG
jgi:hypothetical protein